jgi:hypothetical protein
VSTVTKGGAVNTAFKAYPPWWRDRYLKEAESVTDDLIESGRPRWRIALDLSGGALRARLTARGMPMVAELWARRTNASIVLATAPTLAVIPLMLTIRQVPAIPGGSGWTMPSSHIATTLYLVLLVAFLALISTVIWGYTSLSNGLLTRGTNGRGLRVMARVPGYLTVLAVVLVVTSIVIEPHRLIYHGKSSTPLNGHLFAAHDLWVAAGVAICLCWLASVVLLGWVAHRAELPVASLHSGTRVSVAVSIFLWTMSAAALAMSTVYSKQINELNGIKVQSVVLGQSLLLLGIVLSVLSIASTLGSVLTSRSWKVTSHLAR